MNSLRQRMEQDMSATCEPAVRRVAGGQGADARQRKPCCYMTWDMIPAEHHGPFYFSSAISPKAATISG